MSTKTTSIELYLDVAGIINFNGNLGMGGDWGYYTNPFDATQFMTIGVNGEIPEANTIPTLSSNTPVSITINVDKTGYDHYLFEVDHIRLDLVGERSFAEKTPRNAWSEVLNLDQTDGAIGEMGYYFLGQSDGDETFLLVTAKEISGNASNISYRIKFSIQQGDSIKYCNVDPLLKSGSQNA